MLCQCVPILCQFIFLWLQFWWSLYGLCGIGSGGGGLPGGWSHQYWHWIGQLVWDWLIGNGLANWHWIGMRLVYIYLLICRSNGLIDRSKIDIGLADWWWIDIWLADWWWIDIWLVDWWWIGRLVMDWQIGDGLADWSWIDIGLATKWSIGGFIQDWNWIGGLVTDWQIGDELADWWWIGRFV